MNGEDRHVIAEGEALRRFWRGARGFWHDRPSTAWGLIGALTICVVLQLLVQYWLNLWNRDFFNALERRNGGEIWQQTNLLLLLAAASVALGVFAVWGRMTFQRCWREWLTSRLVSQWLANLLRHPPDFVDGERQNGEYRIAEDARVATDAPIDLVTGLLASLLSGAIFVVVLWNIGGVLEMNIAGNTLRLPGYLVIAALLYSLMTTGGMVWVARHMVYVIERKNQAEADLRYALARLHEEPADIPMVEPALVEVIREWRILCGQHMRTTVVSHGNSLLAPVVGLILCMPNYVRGELQLGEVTQAAAAFFAVQSAFNWLVDNYPRLAEWLSSATRVGELLRTLNQSDSATPKPGRPVRDFSPTT